MSCWREKTKWNSIEATAVSDVLKGQTNMDYQIKPVADHLRMVGPALTVQVNAGDNLLVMKAIAQAKPGDILVVDAKSGKHNAICGDFVIGLAKTMNLGGIVIDGVVRDIAGIRDLNFPVFCLGSTLAASLKEGTGHIGQPIACGNIAVHTGDIILGDIDGVTVVPQAKQTEVLQAAIEKQKQDEAREKEVIGNYDAAQAYIQKQVDKKLKTN